MSRFHRGRSIRNGRSPNLAIPREPLPIPNRSSSIPCGWLLRSVYGFSAWSSSPPNYPSSIGAPTLPLNAAGPFFRTAMTTKTPTLRLAASDKLLSSTILLPKDPLVSCFVYSPIAGPSSHSRAYNDILEMARRDVLSHNGSATLTRSILTSVHVGGSDSCMYAFLIGNQGEPPTELSGLHFDGLMGASFFFGPAECFRSSNPNPTVSRVGSSL